MRTPEQQAALRAKNATYQRTYRMTKRGREVIESHKRTPEYREVQWRKELKRCYGVTPEWYAETLAAQNHGCAICGLDPDKRRLAVDHNHTTGQVRGLLCARHNVMVGVLEHADMPKLVEYLQRHGVISAPVESAHWIWRTLPGCVRVAPNETMV